jgi:hypothetical protein
MVTRSRRWVEFIGPGSLSGFHDKINPERKRHSSLAARLNTNALPALPGLTKLANDTNHPAMQKLAAKADMLKAGPPLSFLLRR